MKELPSISLKQFQKQLSYVWIICGGYSFDDAQDKLQILFFQEESLCDFCSGGYRSRTDDLLRARQAL